jgi:hypothetical protein
VTDFQFWTQWLYSGEPNIGDYIQVLEEQDYTGNRKYTEGVVGGYFKTVFWYVGELPHVASDWAVVKWRIRIEPAKKEERLEAQTNTTKEKV